MKWSVGCVSHAFLKSKLGGLEATLLEQEMRSRIAARLLLISKPLLGESEWRQLR